MKTKKLYKIMYKAHKKELIKLAKEATPFEFEDGLKILASFLSFLRDYYKLNYNVWAMERKTEDPVKYANMPTRLESLEETLKEYELWQKCEDKYFIFHEIGGQKKGIFSNCWIEDLLSNHKENVEAYKKEYEEHKQKFFNLICKYMEEWWD